MGARIMMLFDRNRAALFTAEGRPTRSARAVTHGPLSLRREGDSIVLAFRGPAVIVPDATAYLSIERALASGRLDCDTEVDMRFEIDSTGGEFDFDRILSASGTAPIEPSSSAAFGRIAGHVCLDGAARTVNGFARAGMSFTGLGPQKFSARRMIWACFENEEGPRALEARAVATADAPPAQNRQDSRRGRMVAVRTARSHDRDAFGRGTAASHFRIADARRTDRHANSKAASSASFRCRAPDQSNRASTRRLASRAFAAALIAEPGCSNIRAWQTRC